MAEITQKRKAYERQYRLEHKEHYRQWRVANREQLLLKKRLDYQKNKNIYIKRAKEWQTTHREERNLSSREFRKKYPEKVKDWTDRWLVNNPGKRQEYRRARRNVEYNAEGSHTQKEWQILKEYCNFTCLSCKKKEPEIKLTEDHVVPLGKGGNDYIENIQPLCGPCNSHKYLKIIRFPSMVLC